MREDVELFLENGIEDPLRYLGGWHSLPRQPLAQSLTYSPTPIVVAAILYFLLLWPIVRLLSRLENRALAGRG